jgi:hypothetical protein
VGGFRDAFYGTQDGVYAEEDEFTKKDRKNRRRALKDAERDRYMSGLSKPRGEFPGQIKPPPPQTAPVKKEIEHVYADPRTQGVADPEAAPADGGPRRRRRRPRRPPLGV